MNDLDLCLAVVSMSC